MDKRFIYPKLYNLMICNLRELFVIPFATYLLASGAANAANASQYIELILNHATEINVSENVASAIVANPEYADILTQSGASLIVSGKRIGETNLFLRDRDQNIIANILITIMPDTKGEVSIYRGSGRVDYSCIARCNIVGGSADINMPKSASEQKPTSIK